MTVLYPLRFEPIFRRYLWGGRRLATVLNKRFNEDPNDADETCAESWEICDHGLDQSTVSLGPLAGSTLSQIVARHGPQLFGQEFHVQTQFPQTQFPLLLKFLDASENLSIQVHPDDARAARLDPPDLGKTEAWVVLAALPGSRIWAGLKHRVDRLTLEREMLQGTCLECVHSFEPQEGDCIFIPAGVVHAVGGGLLVAEIQQASDTTYRLFDWDRLGKDGKPRPLHIEQALEAIDYEYGPADPQIPERTGRSHVERLVACDKFVLDRWTLDVPWPVGGDDRFHILAVLNGSVRVQGDPARKPLGVGDTVLLAAELGEVLLEPQGRVVLLDAWLP